MLAFMTTRVVGNESPYIMIPVIKATIAEIIKNKNPINIVAKIFEKIILLLLYGLIARSLIVPSEYSFEIIPAPNMTVKVIMRKLMISIAKNM